MIEKNKKAKNFEIALATNKNIEKHEETRKWNDRKSRTGTVCYLGPDSQHGRHVYLCLGPYGYFVASRETDGCLTYRTASLKLAKICPSKITLELAIRLLDKIDAEHLRKIAGSSRRRSDIPHIGSPITVRQLNSSALYFISICIASE